MNKISMTALCACALVASIANAQYKPTPGEQKLLREAEFRRAEQERKIMAGMDRDAIVRMFGQPKSSNVSRYNDGAAQEQMVYRVKVPCKGAFDEYSMYVYLRNGVVTSFSEHASCSR